MDINSLERYLTHPNSSPDQTLIFNARKTSPNRTDSVLVTAPVWSGSDSLPEITPLSYPFLQFSSSSRPHNLQHFHYSFPISELNRWNVSCPSYKFLPIRSPTVNKIAKRHNGQRFSRAKFNNWKSYIYIDKITGLIPALWN